MLFLIFLLCLPSVDAWFPTVCVSGVTSFPVPCCPDYQGSPCGALQNRGNCMPSQGSRTVENPDVDMDDRDDFPFYFFNAICICKGNFTGYNCGECKFNHYGTYCEKRRELVRREVRELTEVELETFLAKLNYCKGKIDPDYVILTAGDRVRSSTFHFQEASYYDVWCFTHYYATKPFLNHTREIYITNYAHSSTGFLTWHRLFLLYLERQLQRCTKDGTFTIPYNDWQYDSNCTMCDDKYFGSNNAQGDISKFSIFSTWKMVCGNYDYDRTYCVMSKCVSERTSFTRNPAATPGFSKPSYRDVQYCLTLQNVDSSPYNTLSMYSARNCIEGWRDRFENRATSMHNLWHVYCSGTMAQVPISCNDPMFVIHHAFIDKIFERLIQRWNLNPNSYPPNPVYGHGPYNCITPFYNCILHREMLVPLTTYGITYSNYNNF